MSADNWTFCPKCKSSEIRKVKELRRDLEESYGKVSFEEYKQKLAVVEAAEENLEDFAEDTLREDYSQGIRDGVYSLEYRARCTKCDFTYTRTDEVEVYVQEEEI